MLGNTIGTVDRSVQDSGNGAVKNDLSGVQIRRSIKRCTQQRQKGIDHIPRSAHVDEQLMVELLIVDVLKRTCHCDACVGDKTCQQLAAEFSLNFRGSRFDRIPIKRIEQDALESLRKVVFQTLFICRFADTAKHEVALGGQITDCVVADP